MSTAHSKFPLVVAGAGLLGFVVLASGVWHKKMPLGGLTQSGRHASIAFEDGSVMELGESETDLDILRRRRMAGWKGHEHRQVFIMADGREMDVTDNRSGFDESQDFSSGDHLILTAYHRQAKADAPLGKNDDGVVLANLQIEGQKRTVADEIEGKDRVIDGKDRVYTDGKDAFKAPVFALMTEQPSMENLRLDMLLLGDGGYWGSLRGPGGPGFVGGGTTTGGTALGGGITSPPLGTAVPEPSVMCMAGVAGALALSFQVRRRRRVVS